MSETKFNVLVIDDDNIYQFIARKTLEATGYVNKIFICTNGAEAYKFLKENLHANDEMPDVILLDVNMPVMNGWEFLNLYNTLQCEFKKDVQIFLVTSSVNEADISFSRRFGIIQDYIVKPLDKEKLCKIFQNIAVS